MENKLETKQCFRLMAIHYKRRIWITNNHWLADADRVMVPVDAPESDWQFFGGEFSKLSSAMRKAIRKLQSQNEIKAHYRIRDTGWSHEDTSQSRPSRLSLREIKDKKSKHLGIDAEYAAAFADCELWGSTDRSLIQAWKDGKLQGIIMPIFLDGDEWRPLSMKGLGRNK